MIEGDVAGSGVGFLAGHAPRTCRLLVDCRNAARGAGARLQETEVSAYAGERTPHGRQRGD